MTTKDLRYDTVWYWVGGTERGEWRHTLGYSAEMLSGIRHSGYIAFPGRLSVGKPCANPHTCETCQSRRAS